MDRRDKLLEGLDLANMVGVEVGPCDRPIVTKSDGRIIYVDRMDTESLKERFKEFADHDWTKIVDVDGIWGENTIAEAIGPDVQADYVVASHVGEHVPDFVTWLSELASVLKPGGTIRLALPDKRFCFDYLREETRLVDVLTAYVARARIPLPQQAIDFCLHYMPVDAREAWRGDVQVPRLRDRSQMDHAFNVARSVVAGVYHDIHCWAFTPLSFVRLMEQLTGLGLLRLTCQNLYDTERDALEFFVIMARSDDAASSDSWREMAAGLRVQTTAEEAERRTIETKQRAEIEAMRAEITALRHSTSWKITAPARWLANAVGLKQGSAISRPGQRALLSHRTA